jgi:hypothetical protein
LRFEQTHGAAAIRARHKLICGYCLNARIFLPHKFPNVLSLAKFRPSLTREPVFDRLRRAREHPAMGFNRRKMEDQRRDAAEKEGAVRRATEAQVLEDAERLIAAWNERQAKRCRCCSRRRSAPPLR